MKNKELKKQLIENGTFQKHQKTKREIYKKHNKDHLIGQQLNEIVLEELKQKSEYFEECEQIQKARKQQAKKVRDFINFYIHNDKYETYFFTFTYDDNKRKKDISAETLKKYILRAIVDVNDYKLNIDYGKEKERLHYHGIIIIKKDNVNFRLIKTDELLKAQGKNEEAKKIIDKNNYTALNKNIDEYIKNVGYIYIKKINNTEEDITKVSKYCAKLVSHSLKVKQKYISSKKGSSYQEWQKFYKALCKNQKMMAEEFDKYISLYEALISTPHLYKQYKENHTD